MTKNYTLLSIKEYIKSINSNNLLLSIILLTLPLKNIYISIATILFIMLTLFFNEGIKNISKTYYLPLALFLMMSLSLLWSYDVERSFHGLQKQLSFFFFPIAFFLLPKLNRESLLKTLRVYGFGMVFLAIYYLINALLRYSVTHDTSVFFHTELVPDDPGAIYISVFASLAFFYFVQIQQKNLVEKIATLILVLLIFLLSSKSIITIDFIIIICYYIFFVSIPSGTKAITILSVSAFLFFSILFVKEVRERFLIEYETAFIDNTVNSKLTKNEQNIFNVSINEAWTKDDFHRNSFFPGTALRVYQFRNFLEILDEQKFFFKGFGLEASQDFIKSKAQEHNVDPRYGEYNFHNQYLQTFADLGVFGFLILVLMLVINFKNALQHKDFLHIAFSITMIMLFLSESFFCRQRGITFFIILYCLFNAVSFEEKGELKLL